jgi:pSer/pThr/pTyr-binding forkhead associated (FHA) protein
MKRNAMYKGGSVECEIEYGAAQSDKSLGREILKVQSSTLFYGNNCDPNEVIDALSMQSLSKPATIKILDNRASQVLVMYLGGWHAIPTPDIFSRHSGTCMLVGDKYNPSEKYPLQLGDCIRLGSVGLIVSSMKVPGKPEIRLSNADLDWIRDEARSLEQLNEIDEAEVYQSKKTPNSNSPTNNSDLEPENEGGAGWDSSATRKQKGSSAQQNWDRKAKAGAYFDCSGDSDDMCPVRGLSSSCGSTEENDPEDVPLCYMCYDESPEDPLIAPCDCKGDTKFLHLNCLKKWYVSTVCGEQAQVVRVTGSGALCCKICGGAYKMRIRGKDGGYINLLEPDDNTPSLGLLVVTQHINRTDLFGSTFRLNFGRTALSDMVQEGAGTSPHASTTLSIGRSSNCNVVLDYRTVSTVHAYVSYEPSAGCFLLEDHSSSNGTLVHLRKPVALHCHKAVLLRVGRTTLSLRAKKSAFVKVAYGISRLMRRTGLRSRYRFSTSDDKDFSMGAGGSGRSKKLSKRQMWERQFRTGGSLEDVQSNLESDPMYGIYATPSASDSRLMAALDAEADELPGLEALSSYSANKQTRMFGDNVDRGTNYDMFHHALGNKRALLPFDPLRVYLLLGKTSKRFESVSPERDPGHSVDANNNANALSQNKDAQSEHIENLLASTSAAAAAAAAAAALGDARASGAQPGDPLPQIGDLSAMMPTCADQDELGEVDDWHPGISPSFDELVDRSVSPSDGNNSHSDKRKGPRKHDPNRHPERQGSDRRRRSRRGVGSRSNDREASDTARGGNNSSPWEANGASSSKDDLSHHTPLSDSPVDDEAKLTGLAARERDEQIKNIITRKQLDSSDDLAGDDSFASRPSCDILMLDPGFENAQATDKWIDMPLLESPTRPVSTFSKEKLAAKKLQEQQQLVHAVQAAKLEKPEKPENIKTPNEPEEERRLKELHQQYLAGSAHGVNADDGDFDEEWATERWLKDMHKAYVSGDADEIEQQTEEGPNDERWPRQGPKDKNQKVHRSKSTELRRLKSSDRIKRQSKVKRSHSTEVDPAIMAAIIAGARAAAAAPQETAATETEADALQVIPSDFQDHDHAEDEQLVAVALKNYIPVGGELEARRKRKNKKQRESNPSREALSRTVAAGSSPDGEVLPEAKGKEWLPEFTWRDSKGSRDGCSGSSPEGTETEQKDPTERQRPEEQKDSSKSFASAIGSLSYGRGNTASV